MTSDPFPQPGATADDHTASCSAELAQLRVRVIALENLVITLLAGGSRRQLDRARDMAAYISPRPGCTSHRVTLHAALQMRHLARRAGHFKSDGSG
jgi:hypothetical protein